MRNFNERAAERHIPICGNIQAKPKSLQQKMLDSAYKNQSTVSKNPKQRSARSRGNDTAQTIDFEELMNEELP